MKQMSAMCGLCLRRNDKYLFKTVINLAILFGGVMNQRKMFGNNEKRGDSFIKNGQKVAGRGCFLIVMCV